MHAGYDPTPGTVKAQVNTRGYELYGTWAQELGFIPPPGRWCWVLTTRTARIWAAAAQQRANGVPELSIVGPDRIHS
ncbi:MAG: hypothetical protein ACLRM9_09945 [Collinsella aerofaciens]